MQNQARVVVIGGGITGCAILYHLARVPWSGLGTGEPTPIDAML